MAPELRRSSSSAVRIDPADSGNDRRASRRRETLAEAATTASAVAATRPSKPGSRVDDPLLGKQRELDAILCRHDDLCRQLFHLERFVTLVYYDPVEARRDNSEVYRVWQEPYDIWNSVDRQGTSDGSGQGGGTLKPEGRTTRRALQDRKREWGVQRIEKEPIEVPAKRAVAHHAPPPKSKAHSPTQVTPPKRGRPLSRRRSVKRIRLTNEPEGWVLTHHTQARLWPLVASAELEDMLESFMLLESTSDGVETLPATSQDFVQREIELRKKVSHRSFVPSTFTPAEAHKSRHLVGPFPSTNAASLHQSELVAAALVSSKLIKDEVKVHKALARRCARAVKNHFQGIESAIEREGKEEERHVKRLAKWTAIQVKRKWKAIEAVVLARIKQLNKEAERKAGQANLDRILEQSGRVLDARIKENDLERNELDRSRGDSNDQSSVADGITDDEDMASDSDEDVSLSQSSVSSAGELDDLKDLVNVPLENIVQNYYEREETGPDEDQDLVQETRHEDVENFDSATEEASEEDEQGPSLAAIYEIPHGNGAYDKGQGEESEDGHESKADSEDGGLGTAAMLLGTTIADDSKDYDDKYSSADQSEDHPEDSEAPSDRSSRNGTALSALLGRAIDDDSEDFTDHASTDYSDEDSADDTEADTSAIASSPRVATKPALNGVNGTHDVDDGQAKKVAHRNTSSTPDGHEDGHMSLDSHSPSSAKGDLASDVDRDLENGLALATPMSKGKHELAALVNGDIPSESDASVRFSDQDSSVSESISSDADLDSVDEDNGMDLRSPSLERQETPASELRPVPALLRATLRPYQHIGMDWLAGLYTNGLNGILADEMGLGKTIQAISLLAHLACHWKVWGPHLIIVPTSVMLNWEMEFKKFLPGFKLLVYYGSQRDRREKRKGWNTDNIFHVCITSYQLVLADQHIFRRKAWQYLILDEAHNIKNFRSQRWQTLLGFNAQRRLLLTGTPLQNNLMELWSLLYFLMPQGLVADMPTGFATQKEFQEWFSNPMDRMIEAGTQGGEESRNTLNKLHTVLRPYLLRRMKAEVEKQLPLKYEHVVYCRLSKRQRYLYDEFMSRAKTRESLASGNYMSIINCLMQLRKVCNHPNLFEVRPIVTSFAMQSSVIGNFSTTDLLCRKKLLEAVDEMSRHELADGLRLQIDGSRSKFFAESLTRLQASHEIDSWAEKRLGSISSQPEEPDYSTLDGFEDVLRDNATRGQALKWKTFASRNVIRTTLAETFVPRLVSQCYESIVARDLPATAERDHRCHLETCFELGGLILSNRARLDQGKDIIEKYAFVTPSVVAKDLPALVVPRALSEDSTIKAWLNDDSIDILRPVRTKLSIAFPDKTLLQYDCGKLQELHTLLVRIKAAGSRALIFTQMTKMLDILEQFLNIHGWRYLRLDGATKVEIRQQLTERFNNDDRFLCFITSTRSGGVGINLTGADSVVFFDNDWNPAIDLQCQDRVHRIGQTRDVHIYRFVCQYTVEENIYKKSNQKRELGKAVITQGDFTTEWYSRGDWKDMLGQELVASDTAKTDKSTDDLDQADRPSVIADRTPLEPEESIPLSQASRIPNRKEIETALAMAEDEEDANAAQLARGEMGMDETEFEGQDPVAANMNGQTAGLTAAAEETVAASPPVENAEDAWEDMRHIDDFMLHAVQRDLGVLL